MARLKFYAALVSFMFPSALIATSSSLEVETSLLALKSPSATIGLKSSVLDENEFEDLLATPAEILGVTAKKFTQIYGYCRLYDSSGALNSKESLLKLLSEKEIKPEAFFACLRPYDEDLRLSLPPEWKPSSQFESSLTQRLRKTHAWLKAHTFFPS